MKQAVADRVFFHIGVPKSGTTYLQAVLWGNAAKLREDGVLLPARGHTDHRWGSLVVREDARLARRDPAAATAWRRIVDDVRAWPSAAVVSHEFYGGATPDQARAAVVAFAPAEVHLVVTARDPLRTLTSAWQEVVKYGSTVALDDFCRGVSDDPADIWDWRALDAAEVLSRWGGLVPPERVHVVPVPAAGAPRELLWQRFGGLFLRDPDSYDAGADPVNASIGVVECEVMRRVGPHLRHLEALPRSTWLRKHVAEHHLAARRGERFWPGPERVAECRDRGRSAVARMREAGYQVAGDLDELLVPEELPARRTPADVREEEVAAVSVELVARLVEDLREATRTARRHERRLGRLEQRLDDAGLAGLGRAGRALRRRLRHRP